MSPPPQSNAQTMKLAVVPANPAAPCGQSCGNKFTPSVRPDGRDVAMILIDVNFPLALA